MLFWWIDISKARFRMMISHDQYIVLQQHIVQHLGGKKGILRKLHTVLPTATIKFCSHSSCGELSLSFTYELVWFSTWRQFQNIKQVDSGQLMIFSFKPDISRVLLLHHKEPGCFVI